MADYYDICHSCNYLEPIVTYHTDDGTGPWPLCQDCKNEIAPNS